MTIVQLFSFSLVSFHVYTGLYCICCVWLRLQKVASIFTAHSCEFGTGFLQLVAENLILVLDRYELRT